MRLSDVIEERRRRDPLSNWSEGLPLAVDLFVRFSLILAVCYIGFWIGFLLARTIPFPF